MNSVFITSKQKIQFQSHKLDPIKRDGRLDVGYNLLRREEKLAGNTIPFNPHNKNNKISFMQFNKIRLYIEQRYLLEQGVPIVEF